METHTMTPATEDFNWAHYVQVELRQRQVKEELEGLRRDMERTAATAPVGVEKKRGWTSLFSQNKAPQDVARETVNDAGLILIDRRIAEVDAALEKNHAELHRRLHQWLSLKDERYRVAAEVERKHLEVAEAIEPMPELFAEMRTRYGCARAEIGVAYNQETGTLSSTGQASVDRLIASYDRLIGHEENLVAKVNQLNRTLDGTIFVRMRLPEFRMIIAPDCRPGMPYQDMRANFEKGAEQVNRAINDLEHYVQRLNRVEYDRDEILKEYRESEWKRRLYLMAADSGGN